MKEALAALVALALAACGSDAYVVVTVDSRPAVQGATTLRVTVMNGGATLSNDLALGSHAFPVTFSVSSPSAAGDLTIGIDALDPNMQLVGRATLTTALDAKTAQVTLDSADFVVNTVFPGDEYLAEDFEATGTQLAAGSDQTWTAAFRDSCGTAGTACTMHARRFDANGTPVLSTLAAGTNQFDVSTAITDFASTPTMAAAMTKSLAFWDAHDDTTTPSTDSIACRALDATGNAADSETTIVTESGTDVVSATGLANGNFLAVWDATLSTGSDVIHSMLVGPDCTPMTGVLTVSGATAVDPRRSHVATSGNTALYAWIDGGDLHVRGASTGNSLTTADLTLLTHTATLGVQHVRVAPFGASGYAVAVRWYSDTDESVPGKIELYRVSAAGVVMGGPTLVTDKSGSDFASTYAISLAGRADGAVLVAWHACGDHGDGQGCGVFGRVFRPSGAPVGDAFGIPTTILADQTGPSAVALTDSFAVAWNDMSAQAPDVSGLAVRARVIYPPFDDAKAISGASCGDSLPACHDGLVCAMGTDGSRCYAACDASNKCPGGGTCTSGACVF